MTKKISKRDENILRASLLLYPVEVAWEEFLESRERYGRTPVRWEIRSAHTIAKIDYRENYSGGQFVLTPASLVLFNGGWVPFFNPQDFCRNFRFDDDDPPKHIWCGNFAKFLLEVHNYPT